MFKKSKILLVYTGGTIGMMKDYKTKALKAFDFDKLLDKIPEIQQLDCNIETISFDRGGYLYHGRVKSLAEGAREAGLKF